MGKPAVAIELSAAERRELESLARRRKTAQGLARRARIVLAAAAGLENKAIVEAVGAHADTVGKWRRRFAERRLDGLYDEPRPGAPRQIEDDEIAEVIRRTLEETPPDATHWSLRSMASAVGHAPSTTAKDQSPSCVGRIRASTRGWRRLTNRKMPNPMTRRLAPIWICRCHWTRATSKEQGSITTSIASRWPTVSGQSAATRARELLSISPAETASGHPIPGFTP